MRELKLGKKVLRIERKPDTSIVASIIVLILSVLLALLVSAILIQINNFNPWQVYEFMFSGAFGSSYSLSQTVITAIPLMLTGVGIALAARMLLWNIGGDGQIYMGAIAASGVALFGPRMPAVVMIPMMMAAGFAGGALWIAVPGLLRAYMGVNEIITTLMLNYIAISFNDYLIFGPWKDPHGFNEPTSAQFPSSAMLPTLFGSRVHIGILFGLAAAVILYLVLYRTRWGYEIRVTGESERAARYSGMNIKRNILLVMLISGGLAGLAGMGEVAGVLGRLQQGISPSYGYTAILVAVMAKLDPLVVIVVSLLFGGLLTGGYATQTIGVPTSIVSTLQGAIIFFVLAGEFLAHYRLSYERRDG